MRANLLQAGFVVILTVVPKASATTRRSPTATWSAYHARLRAFCALDEPNPPFGAGSCSLAISRSGRARTGCSALRALPAAVADSAETGAFWRCGRRRPGPVGPSAGVAVALCCRWPSRAG